MAIMRNMTNSNMQDAVKLADATFRDENQSSMGVAFPFADLRLRECRRKAAACGRRGVSGLVPGSVPACGRFGLYIRKGK